MTPNEIFEQAIQFFYGEGVSRDLKKALDLFKIAAKLDHAEAQHYLGDCYDNAYGVPQDRVKASKWYLKAAEQGHAESQFTMGCRYYNDISGVKADMEKSKYWFAKAASQGYDSKKYNLDSDKWSKRMDTARLKEYREKLDKLNLKTDDDLENLVKPLMKNATKLVLERKSERPNTGVYDTQTQSHIGGTPYFEKGETWPLTKDGVPLDFVFQFFNTEEINLPKNIKLIQFYYDFDEMPWSTEDDGWLVKVYEKLDPDNAIIIENPESDYSIDYYEIKYETIKTFPDDGRYSMQNENIKMLSYVLNHEKKSNYDKIVEKLGDQGGLHSQIGGYPHFLQGDDTPEDSDFILLFQFDSEDGFMWGDCGLVYAFYNPKTKETRFSLQCC